MAGLRGLLRGWMARTPALAPAPGSSTSRPSGADPEAPAPPASHTTGLDHSAQLTSCTSRSTSEGGDFVVVTVRDPGAALELAANTGKDAGSAADANAHANADADADATCRICLSPRDPALGELVRPCACAGSVGAAHVECLKAWAGETGSLTCELCAQPYAAALLPQLGPEAARAAAAKLMLLEGRAPRPPPHSSRAAAAAAAGAGGDGDGGAAVAEGAVERLARLRQAERRSAQRRRLQAERGREAARACESRYHLGLWCAVVLVAVLAALVVVNVTRQRGGGAGAGGGAVGGGGGGDKGFAPMRRASPPPPPPPPSWGPPPESRAAAVGSPPARPLLPPPLSPGGGI